MQRETAKDRFFRMLGLKRLLAANLLVLAAVAWGFSGELMRNREMQKEVDRLQTQADQLSSKNTQLADLGKRFSEPQVLEREARLKLNLRKPGEQVVVIQGDLPHDAPAPADDAAAKPSGPEQSNPRKWWHYFFR